MTITVDPDKCVVIVDEGLTCQQAFNAMERVAHICLGAAYNIALSALRESYPKETWSEKQAEEAWMCLFDEMAEDAAAMSREATLACLTKPEEISA